MQEIKELLHFFDSIIHAFDIRETERNVRFRSKFLRNVILFDELDIHDLLSYYQKNTYRSLETLEKNRKKILEQMKKMKNQVIKVSNVEEVGEESGVDGVSNVKNERKRRTGAFIHLQ